MVEKEFSEALDTHTPEQEGIDPDYEAMIADIGADALEKLFLHRCTLPWGTCYTGGGMRLFAPGYETSLETYDKWHLCLRDKDVGVDYNNLTDALRAASRHLGKLVLLPV